MRAHIVFLLVSLPLHVRLSPPMHRVLRPAPCRALRDLASCSSLWTSLGSVQDCAMSDEEEDLSYDTYDENELAGPSEDEAQGERHRATAQSRSRSRSQVQERT